MYARVAPEDARALLTDLVSAATTHYLTHGHAPLAPVVDDPVEEVLDRAIAHGDEHVIKFTDTAAEVYTRTGDPDALAVALHVGTLIAPR
jgi:hypothetical protein